MDEDDMSVLVRLEPRVKFLEGHGTAVICRSVQEYQFRIMRDKYQALLQGLRQLGAVSDAKIVSGFSATVSVMLFDQLSDGFRLLAETSIGVAVRESTHAS